MYEKEKFQKTITDEDFIALLLKNNPNFFAKFEEVDIINLSSNLFSISGMEACNYDDEKIFDDEYILKRLREILCEQSFLSSILEKSGVKWENLNFCYNQILEEKKFINSLSYNINELVKKGKTTKVLSRDDIIDMCFITLSRMKKNNILLIGKAGVGKTAIVEGISQRLIESSRENGGKEICVRCVEINKLLSDSKYRGEFEEKLTKLLKYFINSNDIIFIDEIHTILNAGNSEGGISAANILKPYLVMGDIKFIGATTEEEFKKYFANDKALLRRFQIINVKPFSAEETVAIIDELVKPYEKFYNIKYDTYLSNELILSLEEINDGIVLPDTLLDVFDYAGAKFKNNKKEITHGMLINTIKELYGISR